MPPQLLPLEFNEKDVLDFLSFAETQNHRLPPFVFAPCQPPAPRTMDNRAIEYFERRQSLAPPEMETTDEPIEGDPTPFQLSILKILPENLRISEMARRFSSSFWFVSNALSGLERIGLVTRRANRRHWPTERGFALIGITPIPAPPHPCKAGQSIYFGKGEPTPPKPKTQLPSHITITQSNEGYFVKVGSTTLDIPFDSPDLARRGVESFLATKPGRKGLADYYKRKRAALFQFIGDENVT